VPAIVELTPATPQGRHLLEEFEGQTGQLPFKVIEESGARAYYVEEENVGRFKATLDRVEPYWERHLAFRDVRPTE
jgi:hypothetical protein